MHAQYTEVLSWDTVAPDFGGTLVPQHRLIIIGKGCQTCMHHSGHNNYCNVHTCTVTLYPLKTSSRCSKFTCTIILFNDIHTKESCLPH